MNPLIIGSSAIKYHFSDFPREPKDVDYIVSGKPPYEHSLPFVSKRVEYHKNPVFDNYPDIILSCDDLYTLKMSHTVGWDVKWEKHVFDIQFLKSKGCKLNKELFERLYAYWTEFHGENKRSDLEMSAEDFFKNALNTPHDYYHTLINSTPTYTKVLKDGAEVEVSEEKFNVLSHADKLELVREEVYVMAYERYRKDDYREAYSKMLKKFILKHAPIWEAIFIIENFVELHKPVFNYFKTIEDGIVRNQCNTEGHT